MASEPGRHKRYPWVILTVTVVVTAILMIFRWLEMSMADTIFHYDSAILNIATMIAVPVLTVSWVIWLRRSSGWPALYSRKIPMLVILVAVSLLVLFKPRIDGALGVQRWEPRFWKGRSVTMKSERATIQLQQPTHVDFPQFLGPHRNSRVEHSRIDLRDLPMRTELIWKQPIGPAWSGFSAAGGYAFTMAQEDTSELVVCYHIESGDVKWIHRHPGRYENPLGGVGPRSTPTIHDGKIYALGAFGMLVCLDAANGEVVWMVDVPRELGVGVVESTLPNGLKRKLEKSNIPFGRSASPLIHEDKVIVSGGGPRTGKPVSLIAFDKRMGQEVWRGGAQSLSYSSPTVIQIHGGDQILITNEASISGHDPATGRELWNHPWPGASDADANTSQPMNAGKNRVLISKGYGGGAEVFEVVKRESGEFSTMSIWRNPQVLKTKMTSPVIDGQHAYALSDRILECVDLNTGQRIWKNGRYGHGQLLLINGHLMIHAERGFLASVPATPSGYEELGRIDTIRGICWNTLCTSDQFVLVRSDLEAACFRINSRDSTKN